MTCLSQFDIHGANPSSILVVIQLRSPTECLNPYSTEPGPRGYVCPAKNHVYLCLFMIIRLEP